MDELSSLESTSSPETTVIPEVDISMTKDLSENEVLIPPPPRPVSVRGDDFNSALLPSPYATSESMIVTPPSNRASDTKVMPRIEVQNDNSFQEGSTSIEVAKDYYWEGRRKKIIKELTSCF